MKEITISTQAQWDALPERFEEYTRVLIEDTPARLTVNRTPINSSVVARGNSSVVAHACVGVHLQSDLASVVLFAFSVCWILARSATRVKKESPTAIVIEPAFRDGVEGWLDKEAIEDGATIVLYKRVSKDFKTQEREPWETTWTAGAKLEHPKWSPSRGECGEGKFHACSRPYFCDEFRTVQGDRYIAIEVAKADLYAWPNPAYPHKIAFRAGKVLHEVNRLGKPVAALSVAVEAQ